MSLHNLDDGQQFVATRMTTRWPFITEPGAAPERPHRERQPRERQPADTSAKFMRASLFGLGVLAAVAATVSIAAQYSMILGARGQQVTAALESFIPDAASLVFACLGIALALAGKRAFRARLMNAAAVATSVFMNYAAAHAGWRDAAIWLLPPVAYALASDTVICNVRAWALARDGRDDTERTVPAMLARVGLYGLRLALAPIDTPRGLRRAVLIATPLPAAAEPARLITTAPERKQLPAAKPKARKPRPAGNGDGKAAQLVRLVAERHDDDLAAVPLDRVASLATELAPVVDLHPGTARRELRKAVQAARTDGAS